VECFEPGPKLTYKITKVKSKKKSMGDTSLDPNCTFSTREIESETHNHRWWTRIKSNRDGLCPLQVERNYTNLQRIQSRISETWSLVLIYALAIKNRHQLPKKCFNYGLRTAAAGQKPFLALRMGCMETAFELRRRSGSISNLGAAICPRPTGRRSQMPSSWNALFYVNSKIHFVPKL